MLLCGLSSEYFKIRQKNYIITNIQSQYFIDETYENQFLLTICNKEWKTSKGSFAQLQQKYGKEGMEIITDYTQLTVFGGFAPNLQSAEVLSKSLGEYTVQIGSGLCCNMRRGASVGHIICSAVDSCSICHDRLLCVLDIAAKIFLARKERS